MGHVARYVLLPSWPCCLPINHERVGMPREVEHTPDETALLNKFARLKSLQVRAAHTPVPKL